MKVFNRKQKPVLSLFILGTAVLAASLPALAAPTNGTVADGTAFIYGGATNLPTGGAITAGSGTITTTGAAMTVATASTRTVMTWNTFNIGSSAQVNFHQPSANSAALNRVTSTEVSQLMGALNSNGSVFIVNPNGVIMGAGAQFNSPSITINTSTNTPSNADFINGLDAGFMVPNASGGDISLSSMIITGDVNLAAGGVLIVTDTYSIGGGHINVQTYTPSCVGCFITNASTGGLIGSNSSMASVISTSSAQPTANKSSTMLTLTVQSLQTGNRAAPMISLSPSHAKDLADRGQISAASGNVQITSQGVAEVMSSLVNTGGLTNATTMMVSGESIYIGL